MRRRCTFSGKYPVRGRTSLMSAPQLPDVALDGDCFCPDIAYHISTSASRTSQGSSDPSQYSHGTGPPSLESAKSSISFKPFCPDDVQPQSSLPAVEIPPPVDAELASTHSMASFPVATPDNSFLGFCKGAWTLQNGDQKGSMKKYNEADAWSRSASRAKPGPAQYLKVGACGSTRRRLLISIKCREPKCEFRSHLVSSNAFLYVSSERS